MTASPPRDPTAAPRGNPRRSSGAGGGATVRRPGQTSVAVATPVEAKGGRRSPARAIDHERAPPQGPCVHLGRGARARTAIRLLIACFLPASVPAFLHYPDDTLPLTNAHRHPPAVYWPWMEIVFSPDTNTGASSSTFGTTVLSKPVSSDIPKSAST